MDTENRLSAFFDALAETKRSSAAKHTDGTPTKNGANGQPRKSTTEPGNGTSTTKKNRGKGQTREKNGEPDDGFLPLVEADLLFFRVGRPDRHKLCPPPSTKMRERERAVGEAFQQAFESVWDRIPKSDRQRMVLHWRGQTRCLRSSNEPPASLPTPLIEVVADGCCSELQPPIAWSGAELRFPMPLILAESQRLPYMIARALAEVYHLATDEDWDLENSMVEEPYEKWEKRQKADVTEEVCDAKFAALQEKFRRKCEQQCIRVLRRWGFAKLLCDSKK